MQRSSPDSIGVGSQVSILVGSVTEGLSGRVVAVEGSLLYVKLDGERWKHAAPVPVERREAVLTDRNFKDRWP